MNRVSNLEQFTNFVVYIILQLTIARYIILEKTAFCFIYVAFILLLPRRQADLPVFLCVSFAVGLLIDLFYNSLGVHAFASVLLLYSRALLLDRMLPASDYEAVSQPTLRNMGWRRFSLFALLLIGIHHTALFVLDAGTTVLFTVCMRKIGFSTLLTYAAVLLTQGLMLVIKKR